MANFKDQSVQFLSKLESARDGQPEEMELLRKTHAIVLPGVAFDPVNRQQTIEACRTLLDNTTKGATSS